MTKFERRYKQKKMSKKTSTISLVGGGNRNTPATFGEEIQMIVGLPRSSIKTKSSPMLRRDREILPGDQRISEAPIHFLFSFITTKNGSITGLEV